MDFTSFDMNLLRVLDALLSTRSATRAGQRLGLSQPAVSSALGRLRQALGDPLFVRQGRQLMPTDYARSLTGPLRELLSATERLLTGPGVFDPAAAGQSFRILGCDMTAELILPGLAEILAREAPGSRVDFEPSGSAASVRDRLGRDADLAFLPEAEVPEGMRHRPFSTEPLLILARRGHPAMQAAGILPGTALPQKLHDHLRHVAYLPFGKPCDATRDERPAVTQGNVTLTLPSTSSIAAVVSQTALIALLPGELARQLAARHGLSVFLPPEPLPPQRMAMVWHERAEAKPADRWMRRQIEAVLSRVTRSAA